MACVIRKQTHSGRAPIRSFCHPLKRRQLRRAGRNTLPVFFKIKRILKRKRGALKGMIVYCIFLQTKPQPQPYSTDEVGVLCICRGWHAAVVAAAGNWVVTTLFISPVGRLARRPAGFSRSNRTFAGLSGSVTPPFALSLCIKRKKGAASRCVSPRRNVPGPTYLAPLIRRRGHILYRHAQTRRHRLLT